MKSTYKNEIARLMANTPFKIDTELQLAGRPPTMASSEFLKNKEQGDWAEQIVFNAINENSEELCAVMYGHSGSLATGDEGFDEFYLDYQAELNAIGKRPDLLIFRRSDVNEALDLTEPANVGKALAAIEVRSSAFLANRYADYMEARTQNAITECTRIRECLLEVGVAELLKQKSPEILGLVQGASENTFRELDFRLRSWSSSPELSQLSELLKSLKEQIKILHKRDYLSITPKMEDLALVNRWIQLFNGPHYYLQVFFDKAYVIPVKEILEIASDPAKEDVVFSIEEDIKNQGKTTIKINVKVGREILGRIDMPEHRSAMKELQRGRLLFYVTFDGGKGYLDHGVFVNELIK